MNNKPYPQPGIPRPVDVHVGHRLRQRRTLLGLSQTALGEAVGLSFQQLQKYEKGSNRIGASRLYQLSWALDIGVEYFFQEMSPDVMATMGGRVAGDTQMDQGNELTRRETLELVRAYYQITDPKVRKRVFELTKSIGKAP